MRENFRNTPDSDFPLMPEDKYPVEITESGIVDTKAGGKTWKMMLTVVGRKFAGRKLWFYTGLAEEQKPFRKAIWTALGYNTTGDETFDPEEDAVGCKALAEIYHDTYKGKTTEKVRRLRSLVESGTSPKEDEIENESALPF
jgi:hypothetical protein